MLTTSPGFAFIHLRYILLYIPLKLSVTLLKSATSTGSSATNCRFFPSSGAWIQLRRRFKESGSKFPVHLKCREVGVCRCLWWLDQCPRSSVCVLTNFIRRFQKQNKKTHTTNVNWHLCFVSMYMSHVQYYVSFQFPMCRLTRGFFHHKSHYMSNSKLCVSIDVHFYFVCQMSKTCKNFVRNKQCWGDFWA